MRYKRLIVVAVCTASIGACSQKKEVTDGVAAKDRPPSASSAPIAVTQSSVPPASKPGNEEIAEKTRQVASQAEETFRQALKAKYGK